MDDTDTVMQRLQDELNVNVDFYIALSDSQDDDLQAYKVIEDKHYNYAKDGLFITALSNSYGTKSTVMIINTTSMIIYSQCDTAAGSGH